MRRIIIPWPLLGLRYTLITQNPFQNLSKRQTSIASGDLDELALAYATTVHKSQGSEYPAVIVLLHNQHYMMLQRNLLYTAITRGRRLVLVIGSRWAAEKAIETNTVRGRRTSLAERCRKSC